MMMMMMMCMIALHTIISLMLASIVWMNERVDRSKLKMNLTARKQPLVSWR